MDEATYVQQDIARLKSLLKENEAEKNALSEKLKRAKRELKAIHQ